MSDKIKMTREQAEKIITTIFGTDFAFEINDGIIYIDREAIIEQDEKIKQLREQ